MVTQSNEFEADTHLFDEPALAAAQQWMQNVLTLAAKGPPHELFKLFRRDTTVL